VSWRAESGGWPGGNGWRRSQVQLSVLRDWTGFAKDDGAPQPSTNHVPSSD